MFSYSVMGVIFTITNKADEDVLKFIWLTVRKLLVYDEKMNKIKYGIDWTVI